MQGDRISSTHCNNENLDATDIRVRFQYVSLYRAAQHSCMQYHWVSCCCLGSEVLQGSGFTLGLDFLQQWRPRKEHPRTLSRQSLLL